ncbi:MAG: DUF2470 domain-containing protein [Alphaproteobacteria bacterium]|nr:MAG: DUF2470 domain-containing protein [Alphaproteobacteria bacterium]
MAEPVAHEPAPNSTVAIARRLVRAVDRGTLATTMADDGATGVGLIGTAYASLVMTALDAEGRPVFLFSHLSQHTKNLLADPRASLLIDGTHGLDEPLTGNRITLLGRIQRVDDPVGRRRFLARQPQAEIFKDLPDFFLYRLEVTAAHLIAGFGRARWIEPDRILGPATPAALVEREEDILAHMNQDHASAIDAYAHGLLGLSGDGWQLTGIDAEGCDLRRGGTVARLPFETPITTADDAHHTLVALARKARGAR